MIMLKAFLALFLLTKSLHYYFFFTWFQYLTGLFPGNIVFLLTVILLTTCPFFLTSMFWDWGMICFIFMSLFQILPSMFLISDLTLSG